MESWTQGRKSGDIYVRRSEMKWTKTQYRQIKWNCDSIYKNCLHFEWSILSHGYKPLTPKIGSCIPAKWPFIEIHCLFISVCLLGKSYISTLSNMTCHLIEALSYHIISISVLLWCSWQDLLFWNSTLVKDLSICQYLGNWLYKKSFHHFCLKWSVMYGYLG